MKRLLMLVAISVFVGSWSVATAHAQDTKWVRGKVTAMAGDTISVQVKGQDMKFTVAQDTEVVAEGAGTAARAAERAGMAGPKLSEVVKVGDGVEVHYRESGGAMRATEIRAGIAVGSGATSEESGDSARGIVTAVTGSLLTIKTSGGEMSFSVDAKTNVVGRGVGTKVAELKKAGKAPAITDLVGVNDSVVVSFHRMGSSMHASEIRISRRAT